MEAAAPLGRLNRDRKLELADALRQVVDAVESSAHNRPDERGLPLLSAREREALGDARRLLGMAQTCPTCGRELPEPSAVE
jgi:hypothetical protein